jgi:PiT family inorganic phosphate transporter
MNGFHDAANSIATVVSTRVLKPYWAVVWAAFFNFVALFVFELKVAGTVGTGIVDSAIVDHYVVFGALTGAITWNVITWYFGIPSSSSHALVGGIVGAAIAKAGSGALIASGLVKPVIFIIVSPLLGFVLGSALLLTVSWICARTTPARVDKWFRRLQLISASFYSLGHGGNDAQKTVGIIWMLLIAAGFSSPNEHIPYWVVVARCSGAGASSGRWG